MSMDPVCGNSRRPTQCECWLVSDKGACFGATRQYRRFSGSARKVSSLAVVAARRFVGCSHFLTFVASGRYFETTTGRVKKCQKASRPLRLPFSREVTVSTHRTMGRLIGCTPGSGAGIVLLSDSIICDMRQQTAYIGATGRRDVEVMPYLIDAYGRDM